MTADAPAKSGVALTFFAVLRGLPYHRLLPLCFFCLGLVYIYAAPHFEASDSIGHVGMIKWIADNDGALPVQSAGHTQLYRQQASQPPLYYFMMAAIWTALDTSDFDELTSASGPFAIVGDPDAPGQPQSHLLSTALSAQSASGRLTDALRHLRLVTLGMGAVAVAAVYQSARAVMPGRMDFAALACALTAFNPQFIFICASVSNDGHVIMLTALITWQTLLMAARRLSNATQPGSCDSHRAGVASQTERPGICGFSHAGWNMDTHQNPGSRRLSRLAGRCAALLAGPCRLVVPAQPGALSRAFWHGGHARLCRAAAYHDTTTAGAGVSRFAHQLLGAVRRFQHPDPRHPLSADGCADLA